MSSGYKITLTGHVQGVGCRYYCMQVARRMKLHGSASNNINGSVDILLETEDTELAKLYAEHLKNNRYGFSFFGRIASLTIETYSGSCTGDYEF